MNDVVIPASGDLLVSSEHTSWVESALTSLHSSGATAQIEAARAAAEDDEFWNPALSRYRPYDVRDGVLTVPVQGVLVNKFPYTFGGFITGYEYVEAAIRRGVDDSNVEQIVLDVNSPGGLVAGCFDCADAIYAARSEKPVLAVANEHAYSAAYALASAAEQVAVARTGGVGSIGVIMAHMEMSGALERQGVKVTFIYAGSRKKDGNAYEPLDPEAQRRMQARIDALYEIFVSTVARNRGLDAQAVRETEAATYLPREAIEIGLADAVGGLDSLSAYADPSKTQEDEEMSNENDTSAVEQAAHEKAVADAKAAGFEAGKAEGHMEGATAERGRVSTILGSDEGKARPKAALHVALNSDMSAEQATAFLGGLDEEKTETPAPTGKSGFEAAMENGQNPELGATGEEEESRVDSIFSSAGFAPVKH